jgi:hypothetical protein
MEEDGIAVKVELPQEVRWLYCSRFRGKKIS